MTKTWWVVAVLVLGGCATTTTPTTGDANGLRGADDMWAGRWVTRAATRQAIVSQSAVYAYHFRADSAELNALGVTELEVLAEHLATAQGTLHVPRGDQPPALYEQRVTAIRAHLAARGVSGDVRIVDGPTPMRGATGTRNVKILTDPNTLSTTFVGPTTVVGP